jgi:Holliday junction resolvase RusA-like endonuclease
MVLKIPGKLPGLNEIIEAAKQGKGKYQPYALMKEEYTNMITWIAKKLPKYEKVALIITWYEPDHRRDPDNIMAGQKFILDALVHAGVIPNDSQKYIVSIIHRFRVDKQNPRVEVEIVDIKENPKWNNEQELWD